MTPLVTRAECCSREQVPPFWGQDERQAVMDAAELAGLKVLSLMNENTAGAPSSALPGRLPPPRSSEPGRAPQLR